MHRCLYICEVLTLIFKFIGQDDQLYQGSQVGRRTLASLARACHAFSSPALDALWHDLYSLDPILKIFPSPTSCLDDMQWSTFREYAKRVKTLRGRDARVPAQVKHEFVSSLQHYPIAHLPLLPNIVELEWNELSFSAPEHSGISLLRYFIGPKLTTVTLTLMRWLAYSSAELAALTDLPQLCPNVTSFTIVLHFSWDYEPFQEVGRMVAEWPKLRTLRTCAITQPMMDQLFSRRIVESLHIDYCKSSPVYVGRIPDTVREFTLSTDSPSSCTRFFETAHTSPTKFRLLVGMNEEQEMDIEETFYLLPRRLEASRLLSFTILPKSSIIGIPMWRTLRLREPLVSVLVEFTALCELDLDLLCTAQVSDADYERLAGSLTELRSLKLGTANPSIMRPWPTASVAAVISVLRYCTHLETLHIVFDGLIAPPGGSSMQDEKVARSEGLVSQGWGASNTRITKLHVGHSPIRDATINAIASCFESIMPCLVQIEHNACDADWRLVQNMLISNCGEHRHSR